MTYQLECGCSQDTICQTAHDIGQRYDQAHKDYTTMLDAFQKLKEETEGLLTAFYSHVLFGTETPPCGGEQFGRAVAAYVIYQTVGEEEKEGALHNLIAERDKCFASQSST